MRSSESSCRRQGSRVQAASLVVAGRPLGAYLCTHKWGSIYAQQLSTTGNVTCAGSLFVGGVQVTPGGAASAAGDVLKSTRTNITVNNVTTPTNSTSLVTIWSHQHTPSDASSYMHISVAAIFKALSGCSGEFQATIEVDGTVVGATLFLAGHGTIESGSFSPIYGKYTNSSTVVLRAQSLFNSNQGTCFYNNISLANWVHIEEVKR